MTALEQLNGRLTFADTAVAKDQHTLAVNIHQHAVAGDLGRQCIVEIVNDMTGGVYRITCSTQQGTAMLLGHFQQFREYLQIAGDDHGGKAVAHQAVKHPCPFLCGHAGKKAHLALAQDQKPLGVKIIIKPHQLQRRTEHIRNGDHAGVIVTALAENFHMKVFRQLFDAGRGTFHFFHGLSLLKFY